MNGNQISCFKCVDGDHGMIKNGKSRQGKQRYKCKLCGKTRVEKYSYKAYKSDINTSIVLLTKEGLGIRSISRILRISPTTVLKRIITIALTIEQPVLTYNCTYEVDELFTFIKKKEKRVCIAYAIDRLTKQVVDFCVGKRNKLTLYKVINSLITSNALTIFTDKLLHYRYLIPKDIHRVKRFGTNHIERKNLTLRTHLKRLNRKTICFTKNLIVLNSILKIYFWS